MSRQCGLFCIVLICACVLFTSCSSYRAEPLYNAAEKSLGNGAYQEALDGYAKVIDEFPGSAFAAKSQFRIADIYDRHLSEPDRALEAYSEVRYLYPTSPEARLSAARMAALHSRAGDHKKAVEEYQLLLNGPPAERLTYRRLIAEEYVMMNDFRQALIEYEEIAASDALPPELLPEVLYKIAYTYYITGQVNEAVDRFDKIIRRYPDAGIVPEARLGKAEALAEAGSTTEALEILRSLEKDYPNKEAISTRIEWLERRLKEERKGRR